MFEFGTGPRCRIKLEIYKCLKTKFSRWNTVEAGKGKQNRNFIYLYIYTFSINTIKYPNSCDNIIYYVIRVLIPVP